MCGGLWVLMLWRGAERVERGRGRTLWRVGVRLIVLVMSMCCVWTKELWTSPQDKTSHERRSWMTSGAAGGDCHFRTHHLDMDNTLQPRNKIAKQLCNIDSVRPKESWPKSSRKNVALKSSHTLVQLRHTTLHFGPGSSQLLPGIYFNSTSLTLDNAQHGILESCDPGHLRIILGLSSSGGDSERFATLASFEGIQHTARQGATGRKRRRRT